MFATLLCFSAILTIIWIAFRWIFVKSVRCVVKVGEIRWECRVFGKNAYVLSSKPAHPHSRATARARPPATNSSELSRFMARDSIFGAALRQLKGLQYIRFVDSVQSIPPWIVELTSITELHIGPSPAPQFRKVDSSGMAVATKEIWRSDWSPLPLSILALDGQNLRECCCSLTKLRTLDLSGRDGLTSLPQELGRCDCAKT